jgi:cytochrome c oxidase assembly factor CtaG
MTSYAAQVVLLMSITAPLLAFGFRPAARTTMVAGDSLVEGLLQPVLALVAFNAAFFLWFLPSVHDAVNHSFALYVLSLATLLAAATALWIPLMRPFDRTPSPMARLGYILLATVPQTFAGITIALTRPEDAVGGSILALASKASLFTAFAVLFTRLLRDQAPDDGYRRDDDSGKTAPSDPPAGGMPARVAVTTPLRRPRRRFNSPERRAPVRPRDRPRVRGG